MKTLNLENYRVVEMSKDEIQEIEGGFLIAMAVLGGVAAALSITYFIGYGVGTLMKE